MSVRTDVVNLLVNVNGDKSKKELNDLQKKAAELSSELKTMKKNTDEYKKASDELSTVKARMTELKTEIGITALNQRELTQELRSLMAQKNILTPQTKEFDDLQKKINEVKDRLNQVKTGIFEMSMAQDMNAIASKKQQGQLFGLTQVFRELPGFTYSAQTGILGLSNNLPILADNFKSVANAVNPMTGKVNGAMGALKIFGASIFSFGNVFAIAIGLFTIFSDKIFEFMGWNKKGKESIDELSKSIGDQVGKFETLNHQITNLNLTEAQRIEAAKEMKALYPTILKNYSAEEIAAGKAAKAIELIREALISVAMARAAQGKMDKLAAEKYAKEEELASKQAELIRKKEIAQREFNRTVGNGSEAAAISSMQAQQTVNSTIKDIETLTKGISDLDKDMTKTAEDIRNYTDKGAKSGIDKDGKDITEGIKKTKEKIIKATNDLKKETKLVFKAGLATDEIDMVSLTEQAKYLRDKYQLIVDTIKKVEFNTELSVEKPKTQTAKEPVLFTNKQTIDNITKDIDTELSLQSTGNERRFELEQMKFDRIEKFLDEESLANEKSYQMNLISLQEYQNKQDEIDNEILNNKVNRANLEKDLEKQKIDALKQIAAETLNLFNDLNQMMNQADKQQLENELANINLRKKSHADLLTSKRISQAQYNKSMKALDDEAKQKQYISDVKALNRQKILQTASAIMNTAEGVSKAFASYPFPFSTIVAGLIAAQGFIQISTIQNQEVPKAKKGMRIKGKTHDEGGELVEVEDKEVILSANTVSNNPKIVDALLDSSMNKNGASIGDQFMKRTSVFNVKELIPLMQYGGYVNSAGKPFIQHNNNAENSLMPLVIEKLNSLETKIIQSPSSIRAHVVLSDLHEKQDLFDTIKNEGSLKQE